MKKLSLFFIVLIFAVFGACKFNLPGGEKKSENTETKTESVKEGDIKNEDIDLKAIFDKEGQAEQKDEGKERKELPVAFGVKEYEADKEFKLDLDKDGLDESIVLELEKSAGSSSEEFEDYDAFLKINGKRLVRLGKASAGKIFVTDIDANDNYLELFTGISEYEIYQDIQCFHYKDSKLQEIYFSDDRDSINILNILETKSDGIISFEGEGMFSVYPEEGNAQSRDLGQYLTEAKYILKDGFLVYIGSPRYEKTSKSWQRESPYYLTVDKLELFDEARGKKIGTLNKGDVFYLHGVKKYNRNYNGSYGTYVYEEGWAEIQVDGSGKKGWIKVPEGEFYKIDLESEYSGAYHWG